MVCVLLQAVRDIIPAVLPRLVGIQFVEVSGAPGPGPSTDTVVIEIHVQPGLGKCTCARNSIRLGHHRLHAVQNRTVLDYLNDQHKKLRLHTSMPAMVSASNKSSHSC